MKIGDMVKVVDCGMTYSSFLRMADKMGLRKFSCEISTADGWVGEIVAEEIHLGTRIFGVDFGVEGCFIIGEEGLEKVHEDLTKINTPFGQLARETQVALFEAWLDGEEILCFLEGKRLLRRYKAWHPDLVYRVKTRETDIEEITKIRKEMEEVTSNLEKLTERLEELEGK